MNTRENSDAVKKPKVEFTDGTLFVDGRRVHLPNARPKNKSFGIIYDFILTMGVVVSTAMGIVELLTTCNDRT